MNSKFEYRDAETREISFPLGGIGTGSVGFAGNGRLVDWEIFNRPNKGSTNGFSHLAIRAEADGEVLDSRVLNGDLVPPYTGSLGGAQFGGFGFGAPRDSLSGAPHFREWSFSGTFPMAHVRLSDDRFPGTATVRAFNPFIPHNSADSSIPAAFFEVEIANTTSRSVRYTVPFVVRNPFPRAEATNRIERLGRSAMSVILTTGETQRASPEYGELAIATDSAEVSYQEYLFRGSWFDTLSVYWSDLVAGGPFANRTYDTASPVGKGYSGHDFALLAAHVDVEPSATESVRFVLAWYFPVCSNYWNPASCCGGRDGSANGGETDATAACDCNTWRNYYATVYHSVAEVAAYSLTNFSRLRSQTEQFRDVLFGSTLPEEVIDAVSANISILKTPTCLRLEDGTFYGFEGCHPGAGCCEGSCQHVWNYAYALPFLFPDLERSMREADFAYNMAPDGGMSFRLQLPLGRERSAFRPCADGQFGAVLKTYREWKISGDDEWLRSQWPAVRRALEYAWSEENPDRWDRDRDGVLEGRQHHTLDMELFGPNSWLTGFYLGALKAAAEMADHLGHEELSEECRSLFDSGKRAVDSELFNGEYYHQRIDLRDRSILEEFRDTRRLADDPVAAYWDDEHGEIKYQVGEGCGIDQVLGQWHANLIGLGEIFDSEQTRRALRAIYDYNFVEELRTVFNPCRVFGLNDESGTLICSFPKSRPVVPVPYAEETMHGFEYQVACHMIQEGMVEEGLQLVRAVRDRYDGEKRNPWNEVECGSNYARSMASYALLLAMSGFTYDMSRRHIGFAPVAAASRFDCLWSVGRAWGRVRIGPTDEDSALLRLDVMGGEITLESLGVPGAGGVRQAEVTTAEAGRSVEVVAEEERVRFGVPVVLEAGETLTFSC